MSKKVILMAFAISAFLVVSLPALASLVPMSWGFPTLVQNNTASDLQSAFSSSTDNELSNISFPDTDAGSLASSFPTITQIGQTGSIQSMLEQMSQTQYSQFAYPWLSIGGSPVPSMSLL